MYNLRFILLLSHVLPLVRCRPLPPKFDSQFSQHTVKFGESVDLICQADGDQPISITWSKESAKFGKSSEKFRITEKHTDDGIRSVLDIRPATREDSGLYVCLAENAYGKAERSNKLHVIEVPGAPKDLLVHNSWSRSVSLSWTAPFTGNSQITGYVIQYWRRDKSNRNLDKQEQRVPSSQTAYTLNQLHPGSTYEITVLAENEVGRGKISNTQVFTTGEEKPNQPPSDVLVECRWPTKILVSWRPPPIEGQNGDIIKYYVGHKINYPKNEHSLSTVVSNGDQNTTYDFFIEHLNRNTEYSVIVRAANKAGVGIPSSEKIVKTRNVDSATSVTLFLLGTTDDSITIKWQIIQKTQSPSINYIIHYKASDENSWQEYTIPFSGNRLEGEYTLKSLKPNTFYKVFMTANNNFGAGDPSQMLPVKTRDASEVVGFRGPAGLYVFDDLVATLAFTVAAVLVIVVVILACVCVRKAQLEATKPPFDFCAATIQRNLDPAKMGELVGGYGTTHRYVEFDTSKAALLQPNAIGEVSGVTVHYPAPYATLPCRESIIQEMKNFPGQPKPWERPLPVPEVMTEKRHMESSHVYDCPT